ncbi:hypothetical protein D9M69_615400 [compost metagenome]
MVNDCGQPHPTLALAMHTQRLLAQDLGTQRPPARITGVPGPSTLTCLGAGGVVPLAQIVPVTRAVATAVLYQRGATGMATGQGSRSGHGIFVA